jgi:hypothetical protein
MPADRVIIQPENRGTAPAIAYALQRIAKEAPGAAVAFFPSDHYIADEKKFLAYLKSGFQFVETDERLVTLLGVKCQAGRPGGSLWMDRTWRANVNERPVCSISRPTLLGKAFVSDVPRSTASGGLRLSTAGQSSANDGGRARISVGDIRCLG